MTTTTDIAAVIQILTSQKEVLNKQFAEAGCDVTKTHSLVD